MMERTETIAASPRPTQLGTAYAEVGEHEQALEYFNRSVALNREEGYRLMEANALAHAANSLAALGDRSAARDHLKQAYEISRDVGVPRGRNCRAPRRDRRRRRRRLTSTAPVTRRAHGGSRATPVLRVTRRDFPPVPPVGVRAGDSK